MKHSKKILAFGLAASMMAVPCAQALEMPKFSDVPENFWATEYINEMAICKVMEGVGDSCFAPNQQITYAEWAKMICLTFYGHKMVEGTGDAWYADYIATVDSLGLFDKATNYDSANPYIPANRYDVAQIVYKVLTDKYVVWRQDKGGAFDLDFGTFNLNNYATVITDWNDIPEGHKEAVARSYWADILNGMEDGSYAGNTYLTRAQAAKILSKLAEICDANANYGGTDQSTNRIYMKIKNGADRKDFTASTPVKYVTHLNQLLGYEGAREDDKGGIILDTNMRWDSCAFIQLCAEKYRTVSFTVTAGDEDVKIGGNSMEVDVLPAGTTKKYKQTFTTDFLRCRLNVEIPLLYLILSLNESNNCLIALTD